MGEAQAANQDAIFIMGNRHASGLQDYFGDKVTSFKGYAQFNPILKGEEKPATDGLLKFGLHSSGINAQDHKNKGNEFFKNKQYPQALGCYQQAIKLDENFKEAWLNLARVQYKLGQKEEALCSARRASNIDPAFQNAIQFIKNLETEREQSSIAQHDTPTCAA